ncbi:MAG TPA: alpha/beta fold hydrolase [Solirubrobacteraceae bacterium]
MSPDQGRTESKNSVRRPSRTRSDAHAKARPRSAGAPVAEPEPPSGAPGLRGGFDILVTDAPIRSTFLAPAPAAKAAFSLARRPARVTRRLGGLAGELAATVAGVSPRAPSPKDRRFADPAWRHSWLFRRVVQAYLAARATADDLISDAELDWAAEEELRFAVENVADALAPTNFPWSNPAALKVAIDYGGANLLAGARNLLRDMSTSPRIPASVDTSKFTVGVNIAMTPGSVVHRTEVFELIQYAPTTDTVRQVPIMIIPPTINKYYAWDLSPGRSIIEWFTAQGMQVFTISWRNPDAEQAHFNLDTYAGACVEAGRVVEEISGADSLHVTAACSGGQIAAATVGHLVASGRLGHVASLGLFVCALDRPEEGVIGAVTTREAAAAAVAASAAKGYVDGRALAEIFAWLRPNDMIWNYWVNNYLLGAPPPAFDILYWNQDSIRMAAGLHGDMIRVAVENSMRVSGGLTVLGTPIDLASADVPTYVLAGETDHIVPWQNAYRATQMLGGTARFVLVNSGHIQALVNPPDPKTRRAYRIADAAPASPDEWLAAAAEHKGSWWPDYLAWLEPRSGELKPRPKTLGSKEHKPLADAPGTYVLAS